MPDKVYLRQFQALPLRAKVLMTELRIREWYNHFNGNVYVSFSGGKDSTVLSTLVHENYPEIPLVFANTGLEYPEIHAFARKMGAVFVRPKMAFSEVISKYGYPIISKEVAEAVHYARKIRMGGVWQTIIRKRKEINGQRCDIQCIKAGLDGDGQRLQGNRSSKIQISMGGGIEQKSLFNKEKWLPLCRDTKFKISHYCCYVMKKSPMQMYQRQNKCFPYIGTLTEESKLREQAWVRHGCNAYDAKKKASQPLSFWTEQDILHYIYDEGLEIAEVYGDIVAVDDAGMEYEPFFSAGCNLKCTGCQRTGCIFCGFGVHLEKGETRFQKLAKTHPRQYEYCMDGGQWADNPDYNPTAPKMDDDWVNWNPKKIWVPSKKGLGMRHVFDECNAIYGNDFIRYD